jgi:hypothetical protein
MEALGNSVNSARSWSYAGGYGPVGPGPIGPGLGGFPRIFRTDSPISENSSSETVRKVLSFSGLKPQKSTKRDQEGLFSLLESTETMASDATLPPFRTVSEEEFSETASQDRATLYVGTGAMRPFAPVEYPTNRHLDTPTHKNSLSVSEKISTRQLSE